MGEKRENISLQWKQKLSNFPEEPGVYIFKDLTGQVIYVGKAKNLRKRLTSYTRDHLTHSKTRKMLERICSVDFIVTASEKEALLLEANLIKQYRPRYNVILTDDKNYPCLKIDLSQPYPRLEVVRKIKNDGAVYFGPFPSVKAVRHTLRTVKRMFPLRQCKSRKLQERSRPCLNYQIGRCLGPCSNRVTKEDYDKVVQEVILFLQGKTDQLQNRLEQKMREAAENLDFERAAVYRDRLADIRKTLQSQRIVSTRFIDRDIIAAYGEKDNWLVEVLFIRQGALLESRDYIFPETVLLGSEIIENFIIQYYQQNKYIPDEVLISALPESAEPLSEWLTEKKGRRVTVKKPMMGEGKHLVELALENAKKHFHMRMSDKKNYQEIKRLFQKILKLKTEPSYVACVDISHFQGEHTVGSLVVFHEGTPLKEKYRRFQMESSEHANDPAMIAELLERYFSDLKEEAQMLDLLIVDGGKAQLNSASRVLKARGYTNLPVIAIAKGSEQWLSPDPLRAQDRIYLPNRKNPIFLTGAPSLLLFIQQMRDEAHRFAISYQKKKYRKQLTASILCKIPGVGEKRRNELLKHFGGITNIASASMEELLQVKSIPRNVAENIYEFFQNVRKDQIT